MNRYIIGSLWDRENRNGANKNFEYLFEGRQKIDELNHRAESILTEAKETNDMNKDVQRQIDNLILSDGESDAEVIQARGEADTLNGRFNYNEEKLNLVIKMTANPLFYGAKGDGVTNDRIAIQSAIDSMPNGGELIIPSQDFLLSGNGEQLIFVDAPIQISGQGAYSRLRIKGDVPNTTDVIRISPKLSLHKDLGGIDNIQIVPVSGKPARHAVHLDVSNTSQYIARFNMFRNMFLQLGGNGVKLTNPTNNDGFFTSEIEKNLIYGGLDLSRLGDSVRIIQNTITGDNTGINMTGIHGACQVMVRDNNITSTGGAIRADTFDQLKILYNQIEQVNPYNGNVDSMVYLGEGSNAEIKGNNITGHGNVLHNIRLNAANRTEIDQNKMRQGTAEMIRIDSQSNRTNIGYSNYYISATEQELAPSILDNGKGTMGIQKTTPPQNGFGNLSGDTYNKLGYSKDESGRVHLVGSLDATTATKTPGTLIGELPVGFRPSKNYRLNASIYDNGIKNAVILITPTGGVRLETISETATRLDLDGLNFQAAY